MKIIIAGILFTLSISSFALGNLVVGQGITNENKRVLRSTSIPYAIARQGQRAANNQELVKGFIEIESNIYSISSEPTIVKTKKEDRSLLGNWPLKGSTQLLLSTEQDTTGPTTPELTNEGMNMPAKMWLEAGHENSSGCLSQNPLRYGEVNGDKQLFVFFDPSVVVFSPEREKIDINLMFARDDVMPQDQYAEYMTDGHFILKGVIIPQYAALSSVASSQFNAPGKDWLYPAQRSYGKIYIGDFNNDKINDIVMWRKLYFSRPKSDSIVGYKLDAEMYAHFTIINGEYQLQTDTAPETIQGWLAAKNLTWQKGFPSKSECVGQEGQLIPEMHDALLNDPDVLK